MCTNLVKSVFTLILVLLCCTVVRAQPAIRWSAAVGEVRESSYGIRITGELCANGGIPSSWYVYGVNSNIDGLGPPVISFDDSDVRIISGPEFQGNPWKVEDLIFRNEVSLGYVGSFDLLYTVQIDGTIPRNIDGSITVFSANGTEFFPVRHRFSICLSDSNAVAEDNEAVGPHPVRDHDEAVMSSVIPQKSDRRLDTILLLGFGGLMVFVTSRLVLSSRVE